MKAAFLTVATTLSLLCQYVHGSVVLVVTARKEQPWTMVEGGVTNLATGEVISLDPLRSVPASSSPDTSEAGSSLEKRLGQLVLTCYNAGTPMQRGTLTTVIDYWCSNYMIGRTVSPGNEYWSRFYTTEGSVLVSLNMFTPSPCGSSVVDGACNVNLRYPIDQCNTGGVYGKPGGYVTDSCAVWRIDPGMYQINGNDY